MNQNIANLCVRCETRFTQWSDYHEHIMKNQCRVLSRQIKPVRTTTRTHDQIVADVEKTWGSALIVPTGK